MARPDPASSLTQFWLAASLAIYAVVVILGLGVYTPTLRRLIRALEQQGADSVEFRSLSGRGTAVGIALAAMVVVIVFLMVTKPTP